MLLHSKRHILTPNSLLVSFEKKKMMHEISKCFKTDIKYGILKPPFSCHLFFQTYPFYAHFEINIEFEVSNKVEDLWCHHLPRENWRDLKKRIEESMG